MIGWCNGHVSKFGDSGMQIADYLKLALCYTTTLYVKLDSSSWRRMNFRDRVQRVYEKFQEASSAVNKASSMTGSPTRMRPSDLQN